MAETKAIDFDDVWIGLAEVIPVSSNSDISSELAGCAGAVVNSLCLADTPHQANLRVADALESLGFQLVIIHDLEPFQERVQTGSADDDIVELARTIELGKPVAFDRFHTWPH